MDDLQMIYDEIGGNIIHFLKLYKLSKDSHMKPEHVVNLLQLSNEYLPLLEQKYEKLRREIESSGISKTEVNRPRKSGRSINKSAREVQERNKESTKRKDKTGDFDEQWSI